MSVTLPDLIAGLAYASFASAFWVLGKQSPPASLGKWASYAAGTILTLALVGHAIESTGLGDKAFALVGLVVLIGVLGWAIITAVRPAPNPRNGR